MDAEAEFGFWLSPNIFLVTSTSLQTEIWYCLTNMANCAWIGEYLVWKLTLSESKDWKEIEPGHETVPGWVIQSKESVEMRLNKVNQHVPIVLQYKLVFSGGSYFQNFVVDMEACSSCKDVQKCWVALYMIQNFVNIKVIHIFSPKTESAKKIGKIYQHSTFILCSCIQSYCQCELVSITVSWYHSLITSDMRIQSRLH